MSKVSVNALTLAKEIIAEKLKPGGTAIDATVGKGNDAIFMAGLVGPKGKIYGFDIQAEAIVLAEENLKNHHLENVSLINDGHQNFDLYIKEPVDAFMFNLGYLPGGHHNVVTKADSTLIGISKATERLTVGGVITVVLYTGHPGGEEELKALKGFVKSLDQKNYHVIMATYPNQINNPPILLAIERR